MLCYNFAMQRDYREFAVELAKKAGEIIKTNHGSIMEREWKDNATPLTVSDEKINQLVLDAIEKEYPAYSFIGEEGSNLKDSEYTWVCDPIDGTVPFSHSWPTSVFALALVKNGESIFGVIYDPYMDRMAIAEKGKGTLVNNKKVHVLEVKQLQNTVVDIEIWKGPFLNLGSLYTDLIKLDCHSAGIRSMSYGALLVACGEIAAMVGSSHHPWDGAAAKIIVEEAGGKVTDLYGNEQKYNQDIKGLLASNGLIHEQLLNLSKPLLP